MNLKRINHLLLVILSRVTLFMVILYAPVNLEVTIKVCFIRNNLLWHKSDQLSVLEQVKSMITRAGHDSFIISSIISPQPKSNLVQAG